MANNANRVWSGSAGSLTAPVRAVMEDLVLKAPRKRLAWSDEENVLLLEYYGRVDRFSLSEKWPSMFGHQRTPQALSMQHSCLNAVRKSAASS